MPTTKVSSLGAQWVDLLEQSKTSISTIHKLSSFDLRQIISMEQKNHSLKQMNFNFMPKLYNCIAEINKNMEQIEQNLMSTKKYAQILKGQSGE